MKMLLINISSDFGAERLYRSLVRDQKIAAFSGSFSPFPGNKYPGLSLTFAMPAKGHTNEEVQTAIRTELDRLKTEPVSDAELERFRTRAKADLLRGLDNNFGMALQLAITQTIQGDWRRLFQAIDDIEKVTKEDIQRVAQETFVESNRTVAMINTQSPDAGSDEGADAATDSE